MKKRLIILVVIAFAMLSAVFFVQTQEKQMTTGKDINKPLFPALEHKVNDIASFTVKGEEGHVTISRDDKKGWVVSDLFDYPANQSRVRQFLYRLGESRLKEEKTSDPELMKTLGLNADITKTLTVFLNGKKKPVVQVDIGRYRAGFGGTYVQRKKNEHAWLASQDLTVSETPSDWVDSHVLSVERGQVRKIVMKRAKGDDLVILRDKSDDDFRVENMPKGAELKSQYDVNSIAGAYDDLTQENVRHITTTMGPQIQEVTMWTFDGLEVKITFYLLDRTVWSRIKASWNEAAQEEFIAYAHSLGDKGKNLISAMPKKDEVEEKAAAINRRTKDWYYRLSDKALMEFRKRVEDLLVTAEKEEKKE